MHRSCAELDEHTCITSSQSKKQNIPGLTEALQGPFCSLAPIPPPPHSGRVTTISTSKISVTCFHTSYKWTLTVCALSSHGIVIIAHYIICRPSGK